MYTFTLDSGSYGSATFMLTTLPPSSPPSPPLPPLPGYCFATTAVASKAVVVPKIVGGVPVDPARKCVCSNRPPHLSQPLPATGSRT